MPIKHDKDSEKYLTEREIRFCNYVVSGMHKCDAYVKAGWKASTKKSAQAGANQVWCRPRVQAYIIRLRRQMAARLEITAERVLQEMAKIAFADMGEFATWSGRTVDLTDSKELGSVRTAAVREVSETPLRQGGVAIGIKLHDKRRALKDLAQHLGLFERGSSQNPEGDFGGWKAQLEEARKMYGPVEEE